MSDAFDARDLGGRLVRGMLAMGLGLASALAVMFALPHAPSHSFWFPELALISLGTVGFAIAWNALLAVLARRVAVPQHRSAIPRARVVIRRR